jgi:hypothetical protein
MKMQQDSALPSITLMHKRQVQSVKLVVFAALRSGGRSLIRAPIERLPPYGVWPHALSRVATLPDVIFEVLRSKSSLVPSENA